MSDTRILTGEAASEYARPGDPALSHVLAHADGTVTRRYGTPMTPPAGDTTTARATILATGPNLEHLNGAAFDSSTLPRWASVDKSTSWDLDALAKLYATSGPVVGVIVTELGSVVGLGVAQPITGAR